MRQFTEEHAARKIAPSNFDCELPPNVRTELTQPRRPRILQRPEKPAPIGRLMLLLVVAVAVIAGGVTLWRQGATERAKDKAVLPTLSTPQPTPVPAAPASSPSSTGRSRLAAATPAPGWHSDGTAYGRAGVIAHPAPAPRAVLVKLPTPRAELIRLPEWRIGESRIVLMPYNVRALATYKGRLASEAMLPKEGDSIGDAWMVGNIPWIWITTPGTSAPQWVDP